MPHIPASSRLLKLTIAQTYECIIAYTRNQEIL